MFAPQRGFLSRPFSRRLTRLNAMGVACLFVLTAGSWVFAQESVQKIDRTRTFLQVNEVKKMTFQYHQEKPRRPAAEFAKFKHREGLYDEATWQRKARWRRKLRMRNTCTGKLREVENIHSIEGEGTVVTVIRGKNIEKYWVAPFRSKMLNGLGVGDSKEQVMARLGKPYRQTGNVWAFACGNFNSQADGANAGDGAEIYGECLRVYFKDGAVIAAKYFLTLDCSAARHAAFFAQTDELKKMDATFRSATLARSNRFKKYPSFAFLVRFKDDRPKARRKVGTVDLCGGVEPVMESLYPIGKGKAAVILSSGEKKEVYWVGRFKSNKLKGVAAGDSHRKVIRKLGAPLLRTSYALAFACKDWEAAEYNNKTVYKTCLKVFFKNGKAIGAYYSHKLIC